jgi:hypothetical protein
LGCKREMGEGAAALSPFLLSGGASPMIRRHPNRV